MLAVWIMSYLFAFLAGCNFVAFTISLKEKREQKKIDAEIEKARQELQDLYNTSLTTL